MRFSPWRSLVVAIPLSLVLVACGSGSESDSTPTPTATPSDVRAIRGIDLAQVQEVDTALRQFGGELETTHVLYVDLTQDGREEAVVPIASGGTLGNLAYLVLTLQDGKPSVILTRTAEGTAGGVQMEMKDGQLTATTAEYGPEDPLCCPRYLRKTYYRWDGTVLQVDREERLDNPDAQNKG